LEGNAIQLPTKRLALAILDELIAHEHAV
jgi:hypothetical protein